MQSPCRGHAECHAEPMQSAMPNCVVEGVPCVGRRRQQLSSSRTPQAGEARRHREQLL